MEAFLDRFQKTFGTVEEYLRVSASPGREIPACGQSSFAHESKQAAGGYHKKEQRRPFHQNLGGRGLLLEKFVHQEDVLVLAIYKRPGGGPLPAQSQKRFIQPNPCACQDSTSSSTCSKALGRVEAAFRGGPESVIPVGGQQADPQAVHVATAVPWQAMMSHQPTSRSWSSTATRIGQLSSKADGKTGGGQGKPVVREDTAVPGRQCPQRRSRPWRSA